MFITTANTLNIPPPLMDRMVVPRGTSFHRSGELEFPSIGFDPARFSCCCRSPLHAILKERWKLVQCAAKLAPKRRERKPSIRTIIKRAEKTGKAVTSVTLPDGTTLTFGRPGAVKPNSNGAAASLDLDRELEEFEARHAT
jgi:hypothetical protein